MVQTIHCLKVNSVFSQEWKFAASRLNLRIVFSLFAITIRSISEACLLDDEEFSNQIYDISRATSGSRSPQLGGLDIR
jgi:hypothetical protein